ncbi:hypothetical protein BIW11_04395, partial [Tropilaelaps mercedesae]
MPLGYVWELYREKWSFNPNNPKTTGTDCQGEFKFPSGCTGLQCDYQIQWQFDGESARDEVKFRIQTRFPERWTGVAFSKDEKMARSDAVIGWVEKTGDTIRRESSHYSMCSAFALRSIAANEDILWVARVVAASFRLANGGIVKRLILLGIIFMAGYSQPTIDSTGDIYNTTGSYRNGLVTLEFTRKRNTGDRGQDLSLGECVYMMYPVKGGTYSSVVKRIGKHETTPIVSSEQICIKPCLAGTSV